MDYRLDIFIVEASQTIAYTSLVSFVESVPVRILALRYGPFEAYFSCHLLKPSQALSKWSPKHAIHWWLKQMEQYSKSRSITSFNY